MLYPLSYEGLTGQTRERPPFAGQSYGASGACDRMLGVTWERRSSVIDTVECPSFALARSGSNERINRVGG